MDSIVPMLEQFAGETVGKLMQLMPTREMVLAPGHVDAKPFMKLYEGTRTLEVSISSGVVDVIMTCPHRFTVNGRPSSRKQRSYTVYEDGRKVKKEETYYSYTLRVNADHTVTVCKKDGTDGAVGFRFKAVSETAVTYKVVWS